VQRRKGAQRSEKNIPNLATWREQIPVLVGGRLKNSHVAKILNDTQKKEIRI
jgi:hypothetical protein